MPQIVPPPPIGEEFETVPWQQFFEILRKQVNTPAFYSQTTDPGVAGVPNGTWAVWKNTSTGLVKVWANDNGTLKSVTLI